MNHSLPLVLLAGLALPGVVSAQYDTIAFESFDYPAGNLGGLSGGIGWSNAWWANTGDWGVVTDPGFDTIGLKGQPQWEHLGCFRKIDMAPWTAIVDTQSGNPMFGLDGTTIWVSMLTQRSTVTAATGTPSLSDYGGLSLWWSHLGAEQLFVGSPGGTTEYGIQRPGPLTTATVPGTHADTLTHMVVRIDFLPGDDLCEIWIDPPSKHPTTPPDASSFVHDMRFDEIRLQAGSGLPNGWDFDEIEISTPSNPGGGPRLSVTSLVAGTTTTLTVDGATPGGIVGIGYSLSGGGPTTVNVGGCGSVTADLSQPITILPLLTANAAGQAATARALPPGTSGLLVWMQAYDIGSCTLTNSLAELIG